MPADRGQVWEIAKNDRTTTEALIVSDGQLQIDVVATLEITHDVRSIRYLHVELDDGAGVSRPAFAMVDSLQMVNEGACTRRLGAVSQATLDAVDDALKVLLRL